MKCREVPRGVPITALPTDTVLVCAQLMKEKGIGFLPVVDDEKHLIGVVTDRDIALRVVAAEKPLSTEVQLVMTREVVTVAPNAELEIAEQKLVESRKSRIPLVDENGVCEGVISLADIAQYESKRRAGEILRAVTRRETKRDVPLDLM